MNAYELANQLALLLMLNGLNEANTDEINQASHMLRQQADRIAELEKEVENCAVTVDENSQDWKGMDGATAFWLIERHSNNWTDAKKMMDEWHQANTPQTKPLSGEEILEIYESIWNRPLVVEDISFARAIEERILGK